MERKLLLLGLLRQNEMYGYQINEVIDAQIGSSIRLTKPTAYRILHRMAEDGWVTFREEKEGNRPTRRVYAITKSGESHFEDLLRQSLREFKPLENESVISLAYLSMISKRDARALLETRREELSRELQEKIEDQTDHGLFQIVIENRVLHLSAELEWLKGVIERI
jgi:DNA-binding PadR family transcriptional regulator